MSDFLFHIFCAHLCGNPLLFFHMLYNSLIRGENDDNEQKYTCQNTADFRIKSTCNYRQFLNPCFLFP